MQRRTLFNDPLSLRRDHELGLLRLHLLVVAPHHFRDARLGHPHLVRCMSLQKRLYNIWIGISLENSWTCQEFRVPQDLRSQIFSMQILCFWASMRSSNKMTWGCCEWVEIRRNKPGRWRIKRKVAKICGTLLPRIRGTDEWGWGKRTAMISIPVS